MLSPTGDCRSTCAEDEACTAVSIISGETIDCIFTTIPITSDYLLFKNMTNIRTYFKRKKHQIHKDANKYIQILIFNDVGHIYI